MHPDVQKLLALQQVDQERSRLRRDVDSLPTEEARRRSLLAKLTAAHNEASAALQAAEMKARELELAVQSSDGELKKLETRLNQVRNNAEYQATLFSIESVKRDRSQLEEEGLGALEQIDPLKARTSEAKTALDAEQSVFEEFLVEAEKLREARKDEIEAVEKRRAEVASEVPAAALEAYERIYNVRDQMAVCPVEGDVCTGCYTSVKPNDLARLKGASSMVTCGSCQRVLYIPD